MARFLARRVGFGIIVVVGITIIVFAVTRLLGDPVDHLLPLEATEQDRIRLRHVLGLDRPIPVQFVDYAGDLARFDFGDSLWQRRPSGEIVMEHLPATFALVGAGMLIAVLIAVPLGMIAAQRPGSWVDRISVTLSLIGLSIPQFWLGVLMILIFAVQLGWLPTSGRGGIDHLIMPALALGLPAAGRITQMVRSSMIDEMNRQYVVTAEAKGFGKGYILFRHALRNASLPVITLIGWETIRGFAGYAVIVETVFSWPGIGFLAKQAINYQDVVLLQAVVFTVALMVVGINIVVDFIYSMVDPRIRLA
jgi:peptide/nickel transport system permease protein